MDTARMTRLRLVGRGELRRLFGVSATRTIQIAERPDFPAPLDELSVGKIWALDDVIAWAEKTGRTLNLAELGGSSVDADGDKSRP
ncbi:DNA-binding protein [Nakamurella sp. GG22]